jgi:adenylate cyclase
MVVFTPWGGKEPAVMPTGFDDALTQEVLRTELIRIKALIGTTVLLSLISGSIYFFAPDAMSRIWHGNLNPLHLYGAVVPFILF